MSSPANVDIYDGHLLETYLDGDDLVHDIHHPPWCKPTRVDPDGIGWEWACPPAWHADGCNEWPDATSPGIRIIGWRHDVYPGGPWGDTEHDLVAFVLEPDVTDAYMAAVDGLDEEVPFWTCPYLDRWEGRPGHDPEATCAFGCVDEPACVTGGPWPERAEIEPCADGATLCGGPGPGACWSHAAGMTGRCYREKP